VSRLRAAGCVFAEDEARLLLAEASSADRLAAMVDARAAGEPLEHLLGWAEFCGMRVRVAPGVFVPRRRSELLVREAARELRPGSVVVDMCCGTGAVGLALAAAVPGIALHATDIDPAAVACAQANLRVAGGRAYAGDLFAPLPPALRGRLDVVVANAPYVPSDEIAFMPGEARDHEHRVALDGGPDGLAVQRRIIDATPDWLAPDARLLIETGRHQADRTAAAMTAAGFVARVVHDDDLAATIVAGAAQ